MIAAGARATGLRDTLGVTFEGESFDDRFLICDIRADLPGWESERRFYFDPPWNPDRQVLIHPCPDSRFRIDWQVPSDFDLEAEEASGALDERIRQIVGDAHYELVWRTVYRFHSRLVDRMRVGRVLLAGDAAHLVAPFGARGLNSGVADAENAAWKLAAVLHGWGPEALLETYHDERHAAAAENLEITAATMRFLVPPDAAGWEQRRALLEAARTDPAKRDAIDSGRFAEPYWYVDSPLTTPDPSRPFAGRPAKGHAPAPGPGILVPDLPVRDPTRPEVTRFRQLVRDGFLVLTSDEDGTVDLDAPVRVLAASDLVGGDALWAALGAKPREAWVIRPDGHVAAVVPAEPAAVAEALRRALAASAVVLASRLAVEVDVIRYTITPWIACRTSSQRRSLIPQSSGASAPSGWTQHRARAAAPACSRAIGQRVPSTANATRACASWSRWPARRRHGGADRRARLMARAAAGPRARGRPRARPIACRSARAARRDRRPGRELTRR